MKTFVIIHGIQGHSGIHWQSWLSNKLKAKGYKVIMPTFPNSDHPIRKEWLSFLQSQLKDINIKDTLFITHSLGAVTAMDFIEHTPITLHGLISVSGFARDYGMELNSYFLKEKDIDMNSIRRNVDKISIIYGDNDPYVPQEELNYLSKSLGIEPIIIPNGGHLNTGAGYTEFPLLNEECIRIAQN